MRGLYEKNRHVYLLLSSITYAIRAQRLLMAHNIRSNLERISIERANLGCGYCLKIKSYDFQTAKKLIAESKIRLKDWWESE